MPPCVAVKLSATHASAETAPPLATALHEQLGLKLVPGEHDIPVLVIDRIDRPVED